MDFFFSSSSSFFSKMKVPDSPQLEPTKEEVKSKRDGFIIDQAE